MAVPGVTEPRRVRCGVTVIETVDEGPCQRDHGTVNVEDHPVSRTNGQRKAPNEQSPLGGGWKHSRPLVENMGSSHHTVRP